MKKFILLCFLLACFGYTQAQNQSFEGKIDNIQVKVHLTWQDAKNIQGSYHYPESGERYIVRGKQAGKKKLKLTTYSAQNNPLASLLLRKKEKDGKATWVGVMKDGNGKEVEVYFR